MLTPDDPSTTPQNGWNYKEKSTGVPFNHHSIQVLMSQIEAHRRAVGLPTHGAWVEEVMHEICLQNPSLKCHDKDVPDRVWVADDVWRFLTTLKEAAIHGGMVTEEEQLRRIEICKVCPKITDIACRWCGPVAELLSSFVANRKLPKVADVWKRSCGACGCDVTSKTAYGVEVLRAVDEQLETKPDYWQGDATRPRCWMLPV